MPTQEDQRLILLYAQIEDVQSLLQEIQQEAINVVSHGDMTDAGAQLKDVLQSTEDAAASILDAATSIGGIAMEEGVRPEHCEKLTAEVTRIYEACSFQDISGQRIKKVLKNLDLLEGKLSVLADTVRAQTGEVIQSPNNESDGDASLLNGPQLSGGAVSQEEIDRMLNGEPEAPANQTSSQADIDKLFS